MESSSNITMEQEKADFAHTTQNISEEKITISYAEYRALTQSFLEEKRKLGRST